MAKPLVSDELWEIVQPLLPAPKLRRLRNQGRKRLDDRKALTRIPRIKYYADAALGNGLRVRDDLLCRLRGAEGLDLSPACADSASVRAVGSGEKTGPNPTDRGKAGSKHYVLTEANGIPCRPSLPEPIAAT